jgi:hypothetical protein
MTRIERSVVALTALSVIWFAVPPTLAGSAQFLRLAQAQTPAPAASPPAASAPVATPETPAKDATAKPSTEKASAEKLSIETAPARKSALSIPACSVRYLEGKVAGKLKGVKWTDFRRDECGAKDTTAVFPTEISPKYSNEKDLDKARTLTCADQFKANKATDANGGLKWIEKDGGYYGECVIRLKG